MAGKGTLTVYYRAGTGIGGGGYLYDFGHVFVGVHDDATGTVTFLDV